MSEENGKSTIDPGKIAISGSTTLAEWQQGSDGTRIEGGCITASQISYGTLRIGPFNQPLDDWYKDVTNRLDDNKVAADASMKEAIKAYTAALNADLAAVTAQNEAVAAMAQATKNRDDLAEFRHKGRNLLVAFAGCVLFDIALAGAFWWAALR